LSKKERRKRKKRKQLDKLWNLLADAWPIEQRPRKLQKKKGIRNMTLAELLQLKKEISGEEEKKGLGQEVFHKDGKPRKIKYKKQSDNSTSKFHPARFNRQPLAQPKVYYKEIPKKHDIVVRNFPKDHLGIGSQVSDATIGKLHNRTVPLTFDAFGKASTKPGKSGKYSDLKQLMDGLCNYTTLLHSIWPNDYTGVVLWRVLNEQSWGEIALPDEKKRSDLVTEFFNEVLFDNCGKAVHHEYPLVYEQVS